MIKVVAAVAAGGALGSTLRFLTSYWVQRHWPQHFYMATFSVNIIGCFLIGLLSGLFLLRTDIPLELRTGITVGVLGGLTTFSSFSLETIRLIEGGQAAIAFGYLAASLIGGLLAAWGGLSLTRL
ncbi:MULTISPECIES: fluoride efflux transporter CrcB [Pseudomonas]|uniref:Fluoride-specific ion channel FluC n=1 Tax=Pseudomonas segetis TaxID=298908 RepID=A0A239AK53_9PSED|nr:MULTISPECIES: fluoride efflux transporter CrcB [Pseudomonas]SNR95712.1 camphor resistance protein CrcB [Pseudomonas segetis]